MSKSNPESEYLQFVEQYVNQIKDEPNKGREEKEEEFKVKVVKLNEFERKIKDDNFILQVIATLQELYEWKVQQYKSRVDELLKQYEKEERVNKRAVLTEDEKKESGLSSIINIKLVYASLADTFDIVKEKLKFFSEPTEELFNDIKKRFQNIVYDPERGLKTLVGKQYEGIKTNICTLISSLEEGMNTFTKTFQNIVITGPAGVGKTTLAKYLAFYYNQSGILATDIVNVITRPDLVGQYLGETGIKTKRKMINSLEGIIFIDEAYQLGGCPDPDSYGMESITEIVNFLDKFMALSIVIVAGYENEMNLCFFDRNEGLRRRFPNQYKLINYEYYDLFMIFIKGCYKDFYKYYSILIGDKSPEKVFKSSMNVIDGMLKSFKYLNGKTCKRLVDKKNEFGQYIKDQYGKYEKEFKPVSCYFQNQGGDVGILVAKFFNFYYTKNVPAQSFIASVIDLGKVKEVPMNDIIVDINNIEKTFNTNDLNQEFPKFPQKLPSTSIKEYTIPELSKIINKPSQEQIKKVLSDVNIEKLRNFLNNITGPKSYTDKKIKDIAASLNIESDDITDAAQEILKMKEETQKPKTKEAPKEFKFFLQPEKSKSPPKPKVPSPPKPKTPSPPKPKTPSPPKPKEASPPKFSLDVSLEGLSLSPKQTTKEQSVSKKKAEELLEGNTKKSKVEKEKVKTKKESSLKKAISKVEKKKIPKKPKTPKPKLSEGTTLEEPIEKTPKKPKTPRAKKLSEGITLEEPIETPSKKPKTPKPKKLSEGTALGESIEKTSKKVKTGLSESVPFQFEEPIEILEGLEID